MSKTTLLFVLLTSALTAACDGGAGGGDAGDGSLDGAADCPGCLDTTGACSTGESEAACGAGGAMCVACDAGESCVDGLCELPPACSPDNCAGCCDGDECVTGDAVAACGAGGFECQSCASDETCSADGFCELPCEAFCAGCCDASNVCNPGDTATACGVGGEACGACGADQACSAGACVAEACVLSCAGCCSGDTCLGGDADSACGGGGAACVDCGSNRVCDAAACTVSETSRWDLVVDSAQVPERGPSGPWDGFGGLPDVYVSLFTTSSDGADPHARGRSMTATNDTTPRWNEVVLSDIAARQLRYISLRLFDEDVADDDEISRCFLRPTDADFSDTAITIMCPARMATPELPATVAATLTVRLRPH